jgi:hypothetical protein
MVGGITQKGKGPSRSSSPAVVEGAGQLRADEPVPPRYKRRGHGP